MITKWYEVTCDCCGVAINHYIEQKPTKQMLVDDGCVIRNGKIFCTKQCFERYYKNTKK
jgi:hypothetical protein